MDNMSDLDNKIVNLAESLKEITIERRRDLHRHPEAAWTEFRTASFVADTLTELGYEVSIGADTIAEAGMMGVPTSAAISGAYETCHSTRGKSYLGRKNGGW